jgi:transcriptional regulator with XRE-family HTH domain
MIRVQYRHYLLMAEDTITAKRKLREFLDQCPARVTTDDRAVLYSTMSPMREVCAVKLTHDHHNTPCVTLHTLPGAPAGARAFEPLTFAAGLRDSGRMGSVQLVRKDVTTGGTTVPMERHHRFAPVATRQHTRHQVWLVLGHATESKAQFPYVTVEAEAFTMQAAFEEAWAQAMARLPAEDVAFWQGWLERQGLSLNTPAPHASPELMAQTPWSLMWHEAQQLGWDRRALAHALGMSVEALARIESGEQPMVWPLARNLELRFKIEAAHWMGLEQTQEVSDGAL